MSSRILGYFLDWLSGRDALSREENTAFVMVTMNRVVGLPPELLRPGRFDRVFSTTLPDLEERLEIMKIHMKKRKVDISQYDERLLLKLLKSADRFSGAEIENVVVSARQIAFDRAMGGDENATPTVEQIAPTIGEFANALSDIVPVAKKSEAELLEITKYCTNNTVSVSTPKAARSGRQHSHIQPSRNK